MKRYYCSGICPGERIQPLSEISEAVNFQIGAMINVNPYEVKDLCRANLIKYLSEAISEIHFPDQPLVLDLGCGTGVSTLSIANHLNSKIYAVDNDFAALGQLNDKIKVRGLKDKVSVINRSADDLDFEPASFDVILAEGLLNVIGFETGLNISDRLIKSGGYFIIHDEVKDHERKRTAARPG